MRRDGKIVCFGELLLRLSAPGAERLLQTPQLCVAFGGAEANVAVSLACFGHRVGMVSAVPDNALGRATLGELRRYNVDVDAVALGEGRMGLYFLTPGAGVRPPEVLYDRAGSTFSSWDFGNTDWDALLTGAGWFHVSGINAALGQGLAEAVGVAMKRARALGATVSFDCNYRSSLWAGREAQAPGVLRGLLEHADLMFGTHRDIGLVLEDRFADEQSAADAAFDAFPNLKLIAGTRRVERSADHHALAAQMYGRIDTWQAPVIALETIVDRIGAGDAFAAGVIHGLRMGRGESETLSLGLGAAAIKHFTPGDFNLASAREIEDFLTNADAGVRR